MQIFLKVPLTGQSLVLEVSLSDTLQKIKQTIQNMYDIPSNLQSIVFAGKTLENDLTLEYYMIPDKCSMHLFVSRV